MECKSRLCIKKEANELKAVGLRSGKTLVRGKTRADVIRKMQEKYPSFRKEYSKRALGFVDRVNDPIYPEPFMVMHDQPVYDEGYELENLKELVVAGHQTGRHNGR